MRSFDAFLFASTTSLLLATAACGSSSSSGSSGGGGGSGGSSATNMTGGGSTCFSPLSGPPGDDCSDYDTGLTCSFGDEPAYSCTCKASGSTKKWDCSSSGTTTSAPQCHGDQATWNAILAKPLDCTQNSDCCVVVNDCLSQSQIVPAGSYTDAQSAWPYCDSQCNDCIPPAVHVGCVSGQCVGQQDDSATADDSLRQSHCGTDDVTTPSTALKFGCGI